MDGKTPKSSSCWEGRYLCVERNSFFFVLKHAEKVLLPSLGSYDFYSHQPDWKMFESRLKSGYVNKQMIYLCLWNYCSKQFDRERLSGGFSILVLPLRNGVLVDQIADLKTCALWHIRLDIAKHQWSACDRICRIRFVRKHKTATAQLSDVFITSTSRIGWR